MAGDAPALQTIGCAIESPVDPLVVFPGDDRQFVCHVLGLPDDAPGIITHKTLPQDGAANVSVTNLNPEIYFTEPVRGLGAGDSIRLDQVTGDSTGAVEFDLIGVGVDGNGVPTIIRSVAPTSLMTSVTLKPKRGLKLGAKYTLSLSASIVDTDDPPKPLTPYSTSFSTFTPSVQGSEGGFASPGIGLVGNLAFVVRNNFYNGNVSAWKLVARSGMF